MRKEPKSNDKSHGPIKSNEAPGKERAKEKFSPKNLETWAKEKIKCKPQK